LNPGGCNPKSTSYHYTIHAANDWYVLYAVNLCAQDELKAGYLEALPAKLEEFQEYLGSRPWFAGENITFVDFVMYELLDWFRMLDEDVLAKHGKLMDYLKRFEKLPKIEAYMKSDR
jgi:glutathione S-transferase